MRSPVSLAIVVLAVICLAGCGDKPGAATPPTATTSTSSATPSGGSNGYIAAPSSGKAWDPSLGTAEITGTVLFKGTPPKRRPVDMGSEATCAAHHTTPPLDETVIVNANGTLKDTFIWVKKGLEAYSFSAPTEPVVLEQVGCTYVPHTFGIMVGQPLLIRNGDDVMHNVHSFSQRNETFNFAQPKKGLESTRQFTQTEVLVKFKCDVHGWMHACVGVVPHSIHVVVGDDGAFRLPKLPAGTYTLEAAHEELGKKSLEVTVADGEAKKVEFTYEAK